jgi:DNA-binding protein YbaB
MFDKAKMAIQVFKMKKAIEDVSYPLDESGIEIDVGGFMAMSEPKIKKLVVNGVENRMLLEVINKALKKATESSMKKMQEMGKDLEGAM